MQNKKQKKKSPNVQRDCHWLSAKHGSWEKKKNSHQPSKWTLTWRSAKQVLLHRHMLSSTRHRPTLAENDAIGKASRKDATWALAVCLFITRKHKGLPKTSNATDSYTLITGCSRWGWRVRVSLSSGHSSLPLQSTTLIQSVEIRRGCKIRQVVK